MNLTYNTHEFFFTLVVSFLEYTTITKKKRERVNDCDLSSASKQVKISVLP